MNKILLKLLFTSLAGGYLLIAGCINPENNPAKGAAVAGFVQKIIKTRNRAGKC